jgi:hypothetical protein
MACQSGGGIHRRAGLSTVRAGGGFWSRGRMIPGTMPIDTPMDLGIDTQTDTEGMIA